MIMNKYLIPTISTLMIVLICIAPAGASGSMTISVSSTSANQGEIVDIAINASGTSYVGAMDLALIYDPDVLSPTGIVNTGGLTAGALVMNDNTITQPEYPEWTNATFSNPDDNQTVWDYGALANDTTATDGVVNISIVCNCEKPPVGFNGAGSVAVVRFMVTGTGDSPLDLCVTAYNVSEPIANETNASITDGYGEISVTTANGTFTAGVQEDWSMTMAVAMPSASPPDLEFGVNSSATDNFDDGIDDTLPPGSPPGDTYRIYFYEPSYEYGMDALTTDIKAIGESKNWTLMAVPSQSEDITISWNPTGIPADVNIQVQELDGTGEPTGDVIDMNSEGEITIPGGIMAQPKWYRITATKGISTEIQLTEGWNMVSIPVVLDDPSVDTVFPMKIGSIWGWNASAQGYESALMLEPNQGYWVLVDSSATIPLSGGTPPSTLLLGSGWNMIGIPVLHDVPESDITGHIGSIWGWNASAQGYESASMLEPNQGYWVLVDEPTDINIT